MTSLYTHIWKGAALLRQELSSFSHALLHNFTRFHQQKWEAPELTTALQFCPESLPQQHQKYQSGPGEALRPSPLENPGRGAGWSSEGHSSPAKSPSGSGQPCPLPQPTSPPRRLAAATSAPRTATEQRVPGGPPAWDAQRQHPWLPRQRLGDRPAHLLPFRWGTRRRQRRPGKPSLARSPGLAPALGGAPPEEELFSLSATSPLLPPPPPPPGPPVSCSLSPSRPRLSLSSKRNCGGCPPAPPFPTLSPSPALQTLLFFRASNSPPSPAASPTRLAGSGSSPAGSPPLLLPTPSKFPISLGTPGGEGCQERRLTCQTRPAGTAGSGRGWSGRRLGPFLLILSPALPGRRERRGRLGFGRRRRRRRRRGCSSERRCPGAPAGPGGQLPPRLPSPPALGRIMELFGTVSLFLSALGGSLKTDAVTDPNAGC